MLCLHHTQNGTEQMDWKVIDGPFDQETSPITVLFPNIIGLECIHLFPFPPPLFIYSLSS
jgi:hypothetical protein